ncbi:MAG: hypothetical protein ABSC23_07090 [Bryobacteraceae bacterium]
MLTIAAAVAVPMLGAVALQMLTMQPDLYDLAARADAPSSDPPTVGWPALTGKPCDCRVRILGYMIDNQRPIPKGGSVSNFVLVPDAGTLLDPARRIPEEMIHVSLQAGRATPFKSRQLVWAEGVLSSCYVSNRGAEPLYCLTDAVAQGAERGDIHRFFRNP